MDRGIPGNAVKKTPGGRQGPEQVPWPDAQIRCLQDIVHIAGGGEGAAKVGFELRVVRVHCLDKPSGLVRDG